MKGQCLPFAQIPHSTRLFLDYLAYTSSVRGMYPIAGFFGVGEGRGAARGLRRGAARRG